MPYNSEMKYGSWVIETPDNGRVGTLVKEVDHDAWLVSYMDTDGLTRREGHWPKRSIRLADHTEVTFEKARGEEASRRKRADEYRRAEIALSGLTDDAVVELIGTKFVRPSDLETLCAKAAEIKGGHVPDGWGAKRLKGLVKAGRLQQRKGEDLKREGVRSTVATRNQRAFIYFAPGTVEAHLAAVHNDDLAAAARRDRFEEAVALVPFDNADDEFFYADKPSIQGGQVSMSLAMFELLVNR